MYRVVHNPEADASVILDEAGRSIASIHSDGKTMTPAFEPELAERIVALLNANANEEAARLPVAA
jgi:hypothetical protein